MTVVKGIIKAICTLMFVCGLILFLSEAKEMAPMIEQVKLWVGGLLLMFVGTGIAMAISENEEGNEYEQR